MGEKLDFMFERLDSRSDPLTQVLDAVHLGSALSSRTELGAPWALHFGADERRAGFHVVLQGRCWAVLDGVDAHPTSAAADPVALGPGDVIVFPHGTGHTLADHPDTPSVEFLDLVSGIAPGGRIALPSGGDGDRATLLCGSYHFAADGSNPLLRGLPHMLHVPADQSRGGRLEAAVNLLAAEAGAAAEHADAGSALVVARLVDLLFVYALRTWLSHQEATARSWFGALQDPIVGPAVRAVHDDPRHAWTVAALAQRSGVSRAPFARRFREAVGEPPLAYVTRWRMTLAAEMLEKGERVARAAQEVGYENEFAFAKAFKRLRGIAPGQFRRRYTGA
jgi:AraC-like DNA-binding protein